MNSGGWPSTGHTVRVFGSGAGGESLGQFHANVREVCNAIEGEPESTAVEIVDVLGMNAGAVDRAILHLLSTRRILATFGRHKVQTFRVNPDWRAPPPSEGETLSLFSLSLLTPKE